MQAIIQGLDFKFCFSYIGRDSKHASNNQRILLLVSFSFYSNNKIPFISLLFLVTLTIHLVIGLESGMFLVLE